MDGWIGGLIDGWMDRYGALIDENEGAYMDGQVDELMDE